jgi:hypothetical protein
MPLIVLSGTASDLIEEVRPRVAIRVAFRRMLNILESDSWFPADRTDDSSLAG